MKYNCIRFIVGVILCVYSIDLIAQDGYTSGEVNDKNGKCTYRISEDGTLEVLAAYNYLSDNITVYIDGVNDNANGGTIAAKGSLSIQRPCRRFVKFAVKGTKQYQYTILDAKSILAKWKANHQEEKRSLEIVSQDLPIEVKAEETARVQPKGSQKRQPKEDSPILVDNQMVIESFSAYTNTISYYSNANIRSMNSNVDNYVNALKYMESETKTSYINEQQLNGYLHEAKKNLQAHKETIDKFINEYINKTFDNNVINDRQRCVEEMHKILEYKLEQYEKAIRRLEEAMSEPASDTFLFNLKSYKSTLLNLSIILALLIILALVVVKLKKRRKSRVPTIVSKDTVQQNAQSDIIVRRKTTSILKKQSLEDVHENPAYMKIDCMDFCDDSAVRRIYMKNSCIKEIFNMYAEDLRNSENPKEDGCMVLGRWVYDQERDEYYVSLEEIIKPGDDAIFKEYELNFGGKIKLKVSERLRKLRRETNLQYDMTCWVHSHPGLGVFFSNADNSVQMQLKHPTHPKFLTAIVIDILTPNQELGIFTFKHDMTINSKAELKRMYSLEEFHKWALDSDRNSFKAEDYYNLMQSAQEKCNHCHEINLSNGAIIDICQIEVEQTTGFSGWVHGYSVAKADKTKHIVKSVSKEKEIIDNETLGIFIIGSHRSLPTIRKTIQKAIDDVSFVLFYSTTDHSLTTIPVADGRLSENERMYGEENLDNLKIWTRRKR